MVAWPPPPSLLCTVAILLRVGVVAAAGVMSRRRGLQQSAGSSSAAAATRHHHEDVAEDADPALLLPELVGHLLNEAAAGVDDQAEVIRLDDVVWKPLREPDQVKAAGEYVSTLPVLKNEPLHVQAAAAAVENDVIPSPLPSSAVRSQLTQLLDAGETLAPGDHGTPKDAFPHMAQNDPTSGSNEGAANRSGAPKSRNVIPGDPNFKDQSVIRSADERQQSAEGSPFKVGSKSTITEKLEVADANVQADVIATDEKAVQPSTGRKANAEARKRAATVDHAVQTDELTSKKSSTKDKYSQTLPTTPTQYSMATQTDVQEAPWYLFRTSVQKKKLAVAISVTFVLIYFFLCYGLVNMAREMYAEHVFEELDFL
ncbi:hypothetical protein MRX96_027536 [Rhipicephalus microplus]|uniref:uncharacterized protein LOC142774723 n=1 Tax=Rhipicephalus microplus TaxID=6941 RepID=UPI002376C0BC